MQQDYVKYIRSKMGQKKVIFPSSVACIIKDDLVLIQKRSDFNQWGFPGGTMELGESFEETLLREVKEETNLDIKIKYLQGVYSKYETIYPNGDKVQFVTSCFVCEPLSDDLRIDSESKELKYEKISNIKDNYKLFDKKHYDILDDLMSSKKGIYR